jgi:hypothetical protein
MSGHRPQTYATLYDLDRVQRSVVFKASVDTKQLTSTAVLSYPEPDLAGDIVIPEGMDFSPHSLDPRVDLEHRRDPAFGDATVGWARTTCKAPGGYYTVRPVNLECGKAVRPLPVATTHFDSSSRLETQAFAMVERDVLPAVSVEFIPDMQFAKSLGRSPLEPRDAYEFGKCRVVRYTLCAKGVCPSALVAKAVAYDPLRSVLSAGRIGGEELHPTIKKALAHYTPGKPNTVRGGYAPTVEKADMADEYPAAPDAAPEAEAAPEDTAPALGGVAAKYKYVQAVQDALAAYTEDMKSSDSPELRAKAEKFQAKGQAHIEEVKACADAHDAKLNGGEDDDDGEEGDEPDSDTETDMSTDEDGTLKAVRQPYKPFLKACRAKRFTIAEINKAEAKPEVPAAPEGDSPEDIAYLDKQVRLYERDKRLYG